MTQVWTSDEWDKFISRPKERTPEQVQKDIKVATLAAVLAVEHLAQQKEVEDCK